MILSQGPGANSILQTLFARIVADTTTTSTGFVTLLSLAVTTLPNTKLVIRGAAHCSNTAVNNQLWFRITVDGVVRNSGGVRYPGLPAVGAVVEHVETGLAAGAHTILLEWRVNAGTGRVRPVTVPDNESASLLVQEVTL